jgi:hypothetical protein
MVNVLVSQAAKSVPAQQATHRMVNVLVYQTAKPLSPSEIIVRPSILYPNYPQIKISLPKLVANNPSQGIFEGSN